MWDSDLHIITGFWVGEKMEIGPGKEGCYKSQQRHVGSGHKGWKKSEGWSFVSLLKYAKWN